MSNNNKLNLLYPGLLFYSVLGLGTGLANAAELGAELRAGYSTTDNIFLTADNEVSDSIWTAGMTFNLLEETTRLFAEIEAVADYLDYKDTFDSEVVGALDLSLNYAFLDERFIWILRDNYGQRLTDPLSSPNPGNRENINFFTTGPTIQIPLGSRAFLGLEGRYSTINYEESLSDNDRTSGLLQIGRRSNEETTFALNVSTERVNFSNETLRTDFDIHEAFFSYNVAGTRNIIDINVGYTELEFDQAAENNTASGNLVRASWTRVSNEFSSFTLSGGSQYSTQGDLFRSSQGRGTEIGETADVTGDDTPLRSNFFSMEYDLTGQRTRIAIQLNWNEDDFSYPAPVAAPQDRDILGGRLFVQRDLSNSFFVNFNVTARNRDFKFIDREDDDLVFGAAIGYRLSEGFSVIASYRRLERESSDATEDFTENRATLGVSYVPTWGR